MIALGSCVGCFVTDACVAGDPARLLLCVLLVMCVLHMIKAGYCDVCFVGDYSQLLMCVGYMCFVGDRDVFCCRSSCQATVWLAPLGGRF